MSNAAIQDFEEEFIRSFVNDDFGCGFGFLDTQNTNIQEVNSIEKLVKLISKAKIISTGLPSLLDIEIIFAFRGFKETFFRNLIYKDLDTRKEILSSKKLEKKYKWALDVFKIKHEEYVEAVTRGELRTFNSTNERQTVADKKFQKSIKDNQLEIKDYLSLLEYYYQTYSSFDDCAPAKPGLISKNKKEDKSLSNIFTNAFLEGLRPSEQYYQGSPLVSEKRLLKALKEYFKAKNKFANYQDLEFDNFSVSFRDINKILRDITNDKLEGKKVAIAQRAKADMLLDQDGKKKQSFANKYNLSIKSIDSKVGSALHKLVSKEIIKRGIFCKSKQISQKSLTI